MLALILIGLALTPLLVLPLTPNMFATPKELLFLSLVLSLVVVWLAPLFTGKPLRLPAKNPLVFPLVAFAVAVVLNLAFIPEGRVESMIGPGALFLGGSLLAFLLTTYGNRARAWLTSLVVVAVGTLLSLYGLLQLTVLSHLNILPLVMQSRTFTPTGSPLLTVVTIAIGAAVAATHVGRGKRLTRILAAIALIVQIVAAVAYISLMLPGGELDPHLLSVAAGWSVALDALKNPSSLLLGVGLANFPAFFTHVKPLFVNSTPLWNTVPATAGQEIIELVTTTGLVGVLAVLYLSFTVIKKCLHAAKSPEGRSLAVFAAGSLLAFLFTPASISLSMYLFAALGLLFAGEVKEVAVPRKLALPVAIIGILGIVYLGYLSSRAFAAELHMYQAGIALGKSDGKAVYQENLAAISLVPSMASYHLSFSQVNLSLAAALSQKSNLTDGERSQVATLVSQAISEGKAAVSLRPSLASSWQNLGSLYRNLINVAQGSDQFAIQSYTQAVTLDAGNPALRVEFGGLLYQLAVSATDKTQKASLLSSAVQQFQTAVQLKPDYANGYYNLSKALEAAGDIKDAYTAMQGAVTYVAPNTPDYTTASTELATLKDKLPATSAKPDSSPAPAPTTLSAPSPLPSPLKGGPIILPGASASPSASPLAK